MSATILRPVLLSLALVGATSCKKKQDAPRPAPAAETPPPAAAPTPPPAEPVATPPAAEGKRAEATLESRSGSSVTGTIGLAAKDGKVEVVVAVQGLAPGEHGFHIHEKGDCSAPDAKSAGDHFNPHKVDHGAPEAAAHHAGDFGNLTADAAGKAETTFLVDFITLDDGPTGAIGRAFVVHEKADDLKTQPSGNAGARVACGVVAAK